MACATQPQLTATAAPTGSSMTPAMVTSPVVTLPGTIAAPTARFTVPSAKVAVKAPSVALAGTYTTIVQGALPTSYTAPPVYRTALPTTYVSNAGPLMSYTTMQRAAAPAMAATVKCRQPTPCLNAAFHDENAFIQFVLNATVGTQTQEYKELYQFLLDVFLEADTDFDGLVGHERFDYMIERAAMLPRKFGLAPSETETYPTAEARRAAREAEFRAIDTSGDGQIAFDEWLAWCIKHISGKAAQLRSGRVTGNNWNVDKEHFVSWISTACSNKHSKEYKELYHFLQECFTAADSDLDGKVNHAEFDTMIEVAAEAPRRFGFAPSAAQTYASDADRIAARQREFMEMDIHNHGFISFDDWLRWSYSHICGKVATLH